MTAFTVPPDARYLVTLVLENNLNLHRGDEVQVTTPDGQLSLATVAAEPLDLTTPGTGTPTGVTKAGGTTIVHLDNTTETP